MNRTATTLVWMLGGLTLLIAVYYISTRHVTSECAPLPQSNQPKETPMLDTDRPEDAANRRLYNHLPTKHVTVTYECDVACDPDDPSDVYVRSLLVTDGMTGNLRVRNPTFVSAKIGDEVRYLDRYGNETARRAPR